MVDNLFAAVKQDISWPNLEDIEPKEEYAVKRIDEFVEGEVDTGQNSKSSNRSNMQNLFSRYLNDGACYSRLTTDHFNLKFMLCIEQCGRVDIAEKDDQKVFSIM